MTAEPSRPGALGVSREPARRPRGEGRPPTGPSAPRPVSSRRSSPSARLGFRHAKVQRLRRLIHHRSRRDVDGAFVVEGSKVLSEALDAGASVEGLYVAPHVADPVVGRAAALGVPVHELEPGVLERVADTATPQPVLAVARRADVPVGELADATLVVVCVDVRDPGNLGTVLRSAEAAGADAVVCCPGSVDPYNPKCVRASAGSLFHLRLVVGAGAVEVLDQLGRWGMRRLGAVARGGARHHQADLTGRVAFVLGNETQGIPDGVRKLIDEPVTIPMVGRTESLNVGMAAAVLCFEALRQRQLSST